MALIDNLELGTSTKERMKNFVSGLEGIPVGNRVQAPVGRKKREDNFRCRSN